MDSSFLINCIVVFDSEFKEFKDGGFTFPLGLFYYHEISWPETIGILINKHNFSKEEAVDSFKKMIKQFNLKKIRRNEATDEDYEKLVEDANKRIIQKTNNPKLKKRIGDCDIIIIGGFLREGINMIHSGDEAFLKTCEELKINTIPLPKRDIEKENEIKRWANKRK